MEVKNIDLKSFAQVSRQMILDLNADMCEIKRDVAEIRNVYINRLPTWASISFAFAGIVIGSLIGVALS